MFITNMYGRIIVRFFVSQQNDACADVITSYMYGRRLTEGPQISVLRLRVWVLFIAVTCTSTTSQFICAGYSITPTLVKTSDLQTKMSSQ